MLTHANIEDHNVWPKLWKVKAPERCKMHVWLMSQNRLFTNEFKRERGLHVSGVCDVCLDKGENISHVSRDCPKAREIWLELGVHHDDHEFWNSNIDE